MLHFKFSSLRLRSITGYVTSNQQQSLNITKFIAHIIIIIIIIIIILKYSRLLFIRCRSSGKFISQQQIKAIDSSTYQCCVQCSLVWPVALWPTGDPGTTEDSDLIPSSLFLMLQLQLAQFLSSLSTLR